MGTRNLMEDPGDALFSAASIREIAIEAVLHRPASGARPDEVADAAVATGLTKLPVRANAAARVGSLPLPLEEMVRLVTADPQLASYPELVMRVG